MDNSERESIKINEEEAAAIFGGDSDAFTVELYGQWESTGLIDKYQSTACIVKRVSDGAFYRLGVSRTGSPYSEWAYCFERWLEPVKEVEVTIKKWVRD